MLSAFYGAGLHRGVTFRDYKVRCWSHDGSIVKWARLYPQVFFPPSAKHLKASKPVLVGLPSPSVFDQARFALGRANQKGPSEAGTFRPINDADFHRFVVRVGDRSRTISSFTTETIVIRSPVFFISAQPLEDAANTAAVLRIDIHFQATDQQDRWVYCEAAGYELFRCRIGPSRTTKVFNVPLSRFTGEITFVVNQPGNNEGDPGCYAEVKRLSAFPA